MSACYLHASSEEHMTGPYFERHAEDKFKIKRRFGLKAILAVEWTAYSKFGQRGLDALCHKWKGGEKQFLTKRGTCYSVDGAVQIDGKKVIIEFNGCYYHNHQKCLWRRKNNNPKHDAKKEAERMAELKALSDKIIVVWECHWDRNSWKPEIKTFVKSRPLYWTFK